MENEIILYQNDARAFHLEVRLEDETVWLTQQQMAVLFNQTKQNISLHIRNCFRDGELLESAAIKDYLTVQKEGGRDVKRKVSFYNLDVIISVGYRVKSKQGTQFRIWAGLVLKDYLLKGHPAAPCQKTASGKSAVLQQGKWKAVSAGSGKGECAVRRF